ncbi:hypothetical protein CYY_001649 [Polysphondylium violaceum]|uniref:Esterase n=1 Tax=Polysphondylium violaceum TaxID=133409 RepID=A0A8J4Q1J5_9MYCE|nr:hypothetical protein CYY_001649 [Polysphondylium violaceum]
MKTILLFLYFLACLALCNSNGIVIPPSNENINYVGRVDKSNSLQYAFAWSSVQISILISNTTSFAPVFGSYGQNYFNVFIDNTMFVLNASSPIPHPYFISENLNLDPTQTYNITLVKRTEAWVGISSFYGIIVDSGATLFSYPKTTSRSIEFIGDSITCGFGILGVPPCGPFDPSLEDISLTYGGLISKELEAQLYVEAWSGKGVLKNSGSTIIPSNQTLPELYPLTIPTESTDYWNFEDFSPDAIVINLGTNDYNSQPIPSKHYFESSYIDFIKFIKSKYANNPSFFLVCGPMIGDPCCEYVQNVADAVGAVYIDMQNILEPNEYGCNSHPNVAGHAKMASIALPIIQKNLAW